jgi:type VI secretion system secreted protein VgrG
MTDVRSRFLFTSQALDEETFEVVRFRGSEGISRLYEFDITLVSEDPEIDFRSVLQHAATLTIVRQDEDPRIIHGMVFQFEQLHEDDDRIFYRAILAPRLKQADLYRENQLFLDKSVPEVIEEILSQTRLTTDDYELRLTRSYGAWEYICQYSETDFNFISRWMEREGIYYYFQQTEEFEKLIITDNSSSHEDIPGTSTIEYHPPSSMTAARESEMVTELLCRQRMLPRRVILREYNYRRPSLELRGEADIDPQGQGDVYLYGEHFKTPEEGNDLAGIRAEELLCRERVFSGDSTVATLCPGYLFQVSGHYRDSYNQRFLITELVHEGSQAHALFGAEGRGEDGELERAYENHFLAVPADLQFRPERTTPKPRFYGTITAIVDAAGDGQYAEIDDEGRYKVRLTFDQSDRSGGKASRWIRMAQPYAGAEYGMHFPLHRNTEVLLTFIDGDPDRPIIAGSVPNPETMSPITSSTQTQCMIKTGGGNVIHAEDKSGGQLMKFHSPTDNTFVRIGAPQAGVASGIQISTDANENTTIGQKRTLVVTGDQKYDFKSNVNQKILGDQKAQTIGNTTKERIGDTKVTQVGQEEIIDIAGAKLTVVGQSEQTKVAGERALYVGSVDITGIAGNTSIWVGTKSQITIALCSEGYVGGKSEIFVGAKSSIAVGGALEIFVGLKTAINVAGALEIFVGQKIEIKVGGFLELTLAAKMSLTLAAAIELNAGVKLCNKGGPEIDAGTIKIGSRTLTLQSSATTLFV